MYANPRAVLLVRDTIRLIGEIPDQSEGALQKAGFNFFWGEWDLLGARFMIISVPQRKKTTAPPCSAWRQLKLGAPLSRRRNQSVWNKILLGVFVINQTEGICLYVRGAPPSTLSPSPPALLPLHQTYLSPSTTTTTPAPSTWLHPSRVSAQMACPPPREKRHDSLTNGAPRYHTPTPRRQIFAARFVAVIWRKNIADRNLYTVVIRARLSD